MLKVLCNANYVTRRDNEFLRSSLLFGQVESTGSRGVENTEFGKHGVLWKNTVSKFQIAIKSISVKRVFRS